MTPVEVSKQRCNLARVVAVALLLVQLNAAAAVGAVGGSAKSILSGPELNSKLNKHSKLRGVKLSKGDPHQPIVQDLPSGAADGGSQAKRVQNIPARFIVQVAAQPVSAAARDSKVRAQAASTAVNVQIHAVAAAASVASKVVRRYTHAMSGFVVAGPTPHQLLLLAGNLNVVAIWPDRLLKKATFTSPEFLGLTPKGGESNYDHHVLHDAQVAAQMGSWGPNVALKRAWRDPAAAATTQQQQQQQDEEQQEEQPQISHLDQWGGQGHSGNEYTYDDGISHAHFDHYASQHHNEQQHSGGYSGSHTELEYVWDQLGGVVGPDGAGEDIVIGMLDSGIWMDGHPSFADQDYWNPSYERHQQQRYGDGYANIQRRGSNGQWYAPLHNGKWNGTCQPGEGQDSTAFTCNNKVIGCRWYNTLGDLLPVVLPYESKSCLDMDGHGTNTAAIAAGNYGAQSPFTPPGALLSGMAPRARLAVYKVCWGREEPFVGGCYTTAIVAGVDDAIKDGVNILSASLGGFEPTFAGPLGIAFMNAAAANIFVSAAAGNSGPDSGTVENLWPWITTVAASTIPRSVTGKVILGNGQVLKGSAPPSQRPLGPLPIIYAANAAVDSQVQAGQCEPGSLDPKLVSGHIVICDMVPASEPFHPAYNRMLDAVNEVIRAGGAGLIAAVVRVAAATRVAQPRESIMGLPYVQVMPAERDAAINYAWTADATASFAASEYSFHHTAPTMGLFSSRGPASAVQQLVLKPDVTAPGVSIHAAVSPAYPPSNVSYNTYSGTSTATPHVAGIAALMIDKYPDMSPMAIKSAIMTTTYQLTKTGNAGKPFGTAVDYGSGHIDPQAMFNPGLVITSTYADWVSFLCKSEAILVQPNSYQLKQCSAGAARQPTQQAAPGRRRRPSPHSRHVEAHVEGSPYHHLGAPIDPSCTQSGDLNTPSISGVIGGATTFKRTLTAVFGAGTEHHLQSVHFESWAAPDIECSFEISLWPQQFDVSDGEEVTVYITIAQKGDTPLDKTQTGQIVWYAQNDFRVVMPVAVTFTGFIAAEGQHAIPLSAIGSAAALQSTYRLSSGTSQLVSMSTRMQQGEIMSATTTTDAPGVFKFTVPADTIYCAFALFDADYPTGTDLDMSVWRVKGCNENDTTTEFVAASFGPTSAEFLDTADGITPGDYEIRVPASKLVSPATSIIAYLYAWTFTEDSSNTNAGLITVTPDHLQLSASDPCCCQVTATVSGLNASTTLPVPNRYLGFVFYYNSGTKEQLANTTITVF